MGKKGEKLTMREELEMAYFKISELEDEIISLNSEVDELTLRKSAVENRLRGMTEAIKAFTFRQDS
jgi:predicted  nucleic acid-binding Zn-ribbon protein